MKDTPCYGCGKRHILCHADCNDYIEFAKKLSENNEKRLKKLRETIDYSEARTNRISK